MATRTVRLDSQAEATLREIQDATGLPISEALKRGLQSLKERVTLEAGRTPFDVYSGLDHGPGRSATAPSRDIKRTVRAAIRKKLGR